MEINEIELTDKIKEGKKVIVEFWAEWCGPCRMMKPTFEKVTKENDSEVEMYTMNVDLNKQFSSNYGVRSIPTIKVFSEGKVIETRVGVLMENDLKNLVKNTLLG
jgi:thioredoxin 1